MPRPTGAQLLEVLREIPLLGARQLEEAGPLLAHVPDAGAFTAELMKRGWLTSFQKERLLQGRGQDLQVGPYVLCERLGQGGMGEVYKARHQFLNRVVALKVTRKDKEDDPTKERRFLREIQATAKLSHPNIVVAQDAARVDDAYVFAMEFIEGTDLNKLVQQSGPLPITRACEYVRQAALGLQHAFENGLVHRDVKPSNLLLTAAGDQVKITDMGLVRLEDDGGLTESGSVMGTPDFLAPEQATNARAVDIRADLYSLGCTLYFLLAGQVPFPNCSAVEKLFRHLEEQPTPLRELRREVFPEVEAVVVKLMAKRPEDRFQQPIEVAKALEPFCDASAEPEPLSTDHMKKKRLPPRPAPVAAPGATNPAPVQAHPGADVLMPPVPDPAPAVPAPADKPNLEQRPVRLTRRRLMATGIFCLLLGAAWAVWQTGNFTSDSSGKAPITNSLGMQLVWVPAGDYASSGISISRGFYIAARPISTGDFRTFADKARYQTEAEKDGRGALRWGASKQTWTQDATCTWRNPGRPAADADAVVCVSRLDALSFCYWLSRMEKKVYRLPTEAEWDVMDGSGLLDPAQSQGSSKGALLWEWCTDPLMQPGESRPESALLRARGGEDGTARRLSVAPGLRRNDTGFRVVLESGVR